jgi:hypothetical protein
LADAVQKWFQPGFAVLNLLEKCLPLTGHHRTLHFGMNYLNEMDTLFRCLEVFPRADNETTLQQHFDRCCAQKPAALKYFCVGDLALCHTALIDLPLCAAPLSSLAKTLRTVPAQIDV